MADRSLQFFAKYVIDHGNGGTFKMNNLDGTPDRRREEQLLQRRVSLDRDLLLHVPVRQPDAPSKADRALLQARGSRGERVDSANPVSIDDASIQIQSVTLDGVPLTTFSATTREVTLAAGQGGKLRVVFAPAP